MGEDDVAGEEIMQDTSGEMEEKELVGQRVEAGDEEEVVGTGKVGGDGSEEMPSRSAEAGREARVQQAVPQC